MALDFSPLDRRQQTLQSQSLGSDSISKVLSSAFGAGNKYLETNNKRRQAILSNTKLDDDLTVDATVNDNYQQKFNDMVRQVLLDFLSKKGKFGYISPEDENIASALRKQFERELDLAKNTVNYWNQAKLIQEDPKNFGIYELDEDKWNGFLDIMTGDYDANPSAYMKSLFKGAEVTESPFLKIKSADVDSINNAVLNEAIKKLPSDEEILQNEYQRNGTVVTSTNVQRVLDSSKKEMLSDVMFNMIKSGNYGDLRNIAKGAQMSMNRTMPQSTNPLAAIAYSIDNKVNEYFSGKEKAVIETKKTIATKPSTKSGDGSGSYTKIEKTKVGADFGSTPIFIDKKITYTDDSGRTKTETFKNASIVSVDLNNNTAGVVVPKGKNESLAEALMNSRKESGLDTEDTSMDDQFMEALLSSEKYKTVTVDLENVYNELKAGFNKRKLYLEGFNDIKFEDKDSQDEDVKKKKDSQLKDQEQQSTSGFRTFDPSSIIPENNIPVFEYDEQKIKEKQVEDKNKREEKKNAYGSYIKEANAELDKLMAKAESELSSAKGETNIIESFAGRILSGESNLDPSDPYQRPTSLPGNMQDVSDSYDKIRRLTEAKDLLKKAEKYLDTSDSGLLEAVYKSPLAKDFFTVGLNEVLRNFDVMEIANASKERDLTDDEKMALFAYGLNQTIRGDEDVERKLSSMVGSGVVDMVPFMVQFAATGSVASGASTTTKQMIKSLTGKQVNKYVLTAISELTGAGARAAFMPELYRQIPERMIGQISPEITKEGSFVGKVNEETQKEFGEALTRSYLNTVIEVGVEGMGKYTPKVIDDIGKKFGKNIMVETITPSTIKELRTLSGFNDIFSEFAEEVVTAYAQAPIEEQGLKDVWDNKQMLSTFLTVAVTGGAFSGLDLAVNGATQLKQMAVKDFRKSEDGLSFNKQIKVDKILEKDNIDDMTPALDLLIKEEKSNGATDGDIKSIIDYAGQKIRVYGANEAENIIREEKRNEAEIKPKEGAGGVEAVKEEKAAEIEQKKGLKEDVKEEELPDNVIKTKEGLFELNDLQTEHRKDMISKYGKERADELMQSFIDVNNLQKYKYTPSEHAKLKKSEKENLQKESESKKEVGGLDVAPEKKSKEEISSSVKIDPNKISLSTSKTRNVGKNLSSSLGKTIETKNIEVEGKNVGYIEAGVFDDGNIRMNNIRIEDENFKGKGVGKQAYIQLNDEAKKAGGVLVSSETMSEEANRVWESLVMDGVAVKEGQIYKFKQYAEEKQSGQVREEGTEIGEIESVVDKDMSEVNRTKLPDGKKEEKKERKLGKKALESLDLPEDFKKDLSERGISYAVKGRKFEDKEISEIVRAYSISGNIGELKEVIMNKGSEIPGNVRTALSVKYVQSRLDLAKKSTLKDRISLTKDAVDVFNSDMLSSTEQAQSLESKKRWSNVVGRNPDLIVESYRSKAKRENSKKLESYKDDIQNAQTIIDDFLNSKKFNDIVEEKVGKKFEEYKKEKISSSNRIERGQAKLADAIDRMASIKGIKKNAIDENHINDNIFNILKDAADGILDIGIGSIESLISKLKVSFRDYIKPSDINKVAAKIVQETNAEKRLTKKSSKKIVLTAKELNNLVNSLYGKMVKANRTQIKKLAMDYIDRVVESGEMDKEAFKDLFASALGMDSLTPEIESKLRESAESLNDARVIGENLKKQWEEYKDAKEKNKDVTLLERSIDEQISEHNKALDKAKFANVAISEMFSDDKTIGELMATFIQGNLLTPASQLTNIAANATWAPIRGVKSIVATFMDMGLSEIGKLKSKLKKGIDVEKHPYLHRALNKLPDEQRVYDYFSASKGYYPGFKEGFIEALQQMRTGYMPDDVYRREISQALHPIKSMVKNIEMMTGKEKANLIKIVRNTLEGTIGIPPEIMFRFLNLGDKPFRRAAEKARLYEIAKFKGLTGKSRDIFVSMPDAESMEDARMAGLEATYQQDTKISRFINGFTGYTKKDAMENMNRVDKAIRGMWHLLVKANIPYVKTPINIAIETFDYAIPIWSIFQGANYAINGNRRKAVDYFSKAIVGSMISGAFTTLLRAGIMSLAPAGQEEEEEGKAKVKYSEFRDKPAYHVNMSAFSRYLQGEDPVWRETDLIIENKRFGIISSIAMSKAEAMRGYKIGDVEFNDDSYISKSLAGVLPVLRSSLDQSFLSGVNSGLTALMKGGYEQDKYFLNLARSFSASVVPNTYVAINQYRDGYIREIKDKSLKGIEKNKKELKNQFKSMLTTNNGLPAKVTLWGEDVTRVPDGRGIGYILFDITRAKRYGGDFGVKLHELYERTNELSVLPPVINPSISYNGNRVSLNGELEYKYKKIIGNNRKFFVESLVESMDWDNLSDYMKIELLNRTYSAANEQNSMLRQMFIYQNIDEIERLNKEQNEEK